MLAGGLGQRRVLEPGAPFGGQQHQLASVADPVVVEHRTDPLLPLAAIIDQRVPQPHPSTEVEQMLGWDPALRQLAEHQQLAQMPGVCPVGLRPLLVAAQRARLCRLGKMHPGAHRPQLLDHEPPTSRSLQRHLELPAGEPLKEAAHRLPVRRRYPPPGDLARVVSIHSAVICARC
jgi:hypothetical protein